MGTQRRRPRRVDEDTDFKPNSIDDRIPQAIMMENAHHCTLSNIRSTGSISITGENNLFQDVTIYEPGVLSVNGNNNVFRNVRRVMRKR